MNTTYPITGTFIDEITYDIPCSNWSKKQWADDLDHMKAVGIDTLIFIRGGLGNRTIFPSEHFHSTSMFDFCGFILDEAAKRDMKVFIGLYISHITWHEGDYKEEVRLNRLFMDEVVARYKDKPAFKGWYIPHEVCCNMLNIIPLTKQLTYLCKEKAADKEVLLSPFFRSAVTSPEGFTPERFADEWNDLFDQFGDCIDICAYQDGSAPLTTMGDYFRLIKPVCDAHHVRLWSNTETFERDVRAQYYPIPFDVLNAKVQCTKQYVEKHITFEFSHFMSPQSIYLSARNLYNVYKDYYEAHPFLG